MYIKGLLWCLACHKYSISGILLLTTQVSEVSVTPEWRTSILENGFRYHWCMSSGRRHKKVHEMDKCVEQRSQLKCPELKCSKWVKWASLSTSINEVPPGKGRLHSLSKECGCYSAWVDCCHSKIWPSFAGSPVLFCQKKPEISPHLNVGNSIQLNKLNTRVGWIVACWPPDCREEGWGQNLEEHNVKGVGGVPWLV